MSNYEQALAQARNLYKTGDFDSLRRALFILKDLRKQASEEGISFDDNGLERDVSQALITIIKNELTSLINQDGALNKDDVSELLNTWEQATLGGTSAELDDYRLRLDRRLDREQRQIVYERAKRDIESEWAKAREKAEEGQTAAFLKEYYDSAAEIARAAASNHPNYAPLQELVDEANNRRELALKEQEEMLSGFQLHEYARTLRYLYQLSKDDFAQTFDARGIPGERVKRDIAIDLITAQAKEYINTKVLEYIDNANRKLENFEPRAAAAALAEKDKFNELEDENLITDLYDSDTQSALEAVQEDINTHLGRLHNAESIAEDAGRTAEGNALAGYEEYRTALASYDGAAKSDTLTTTRDRIRGHLIKEIDEILLKSEAEFDTAQANELFISNLLTDLIKRMTDTKKAYENVQDIPLTDRLYRIDLLSNSLKQEQNTIQQIKDKLNSIRSALTSNPQNADRQIRMLQSDADLNLLQAHPDYDNLVRDINTRVNLSFELDRLQGFLDNPNEARVERAIEQARESADSGDDMALEFETLTTNLEAHLHLLRIDGITRRDGYEEALNRLRPYRDLTTLKSEILANINDKYDQLNGEAKQAGEERNKIETARQLHKDGDIESAYRKLLEVGNLPNRSEQLEKQQLIEQVKSELIKNIIRYFRDLTIETEFSLDDYNERIETLRDLDYSQAENFIRRTKNYVGVQEARNDINKPDATKQDYIRAQQQLESIHTSAIGKEKEYISKLLLTIMQEILQADRAEQHGNLQNADSETIHNIATTRLLEIRNQLKSMVNMASDSLTKIRYVTWEIETLVWIAQYSNAQNTQSKYFADAARLSEELEFYHNSEVNRQSELTEDEKFILKEAKDIAEIGTKGPRLLDGMLTIEKDVTVTSSFGLFAQAVNNWHALITQKNNKFAEFNEWFKKYTENVKIELREIIAENESPDNRYGSENIAHYAKLLILDKDDIQGREMLNSLPRIAENLRSQVKVISDEILVTDEGTQAGSSTILDDQIVTLEDIQSQVFLLDNLSKTFMHIPAFQENSKTLNEESTRVNRQLKEILDKLRIFRSRIDSHKGYLEGFNLIEDEEHGLGDVSERFEDDWENFLSSLDNIDDRLQTHPSLTFFKREIVEVYKARFTQLADLLLEFRRQFEKENYIDCRTIVDDSQFDKTLLNNNPIYDLFNVKDPLAEGNQQLTGWKSINNISRERAKYLQIIKDWGEAFAMPDNIEEVVEEHHSDDFPDSDYVINWLNQRRETIRMKEKGDFVEAQATIDSMVGDAGSTVDDKKSLEKAIHELKKVPLATLGDDITGDYPKGISSAGTNKGKRLIRWMRKHRLELYETWRNDALSLKATINHDAAKWTNAKSTFTNAMVQLSTILKNRTLFGSIKDKKGLKEQYKRATEAIDIMDAISPNHPDLSSIKDNKQYKESKKEVSKK